MRGEGHEVGVHTYTHVNLANVPPWRQRMELDQTQLAIAAASGYTTDLARPPYSSTLDALAPVGLAGAPARRATTARSSPTSTPRTGPSRASTRSSAGGIPRGRDGAVVMLHDGGGDRTQTVAALGTLIEELKERGYTFDTVTSAIGAPSPWHRATASQRLQGQLASRRRTESPTPSSRCSGSP